jgi:hypothetical protein
MFSTRSIFAHPVAGLLISLMIIHCAETSGEHHRAVIPKNPEPHTHEEPYVPIPFDTRPVVTTTSTSADFDFSSFIKSL